MEHFQLDRTKRHCTGQTKKNYPETIKFEFVIFQIRLSNPIPFSSIIRPIRLPQAGSEPLGIGTFTGWGNIESLQTFYKKQLSRRSQTVNAVQQLKVWI